MENETFRTRLELTPRIMLGADGKLGQLSLEKQASMIAAQANRLIEWLYDPVPNELGWAAGDRAPAGIKEDSINWGDLQVVEVKPFADGTFEVIVEEAAPDAAHLQTWLTSWLKAWGWNVVVRTEW